MGCFYSSLPASAFSEVMLKAWNWSWWEYLHHGNWKKKISNQDFPPREIVVRTFTDIPLWLTKVSFTLYILDWKKSGCYSKHKASSSKCTYLCSYLELGVTLCVLVIHKEEESIKRVMLDVPSLCSYVSGYIYEMSACSLVWSRASPHNSHLFCMVWTQFHILTLAAESYYWTPQHLFQQQWVPGQKK